MEDLDLSAIDPLKWAEVRRRAQTVRSYLALHKPDPGDRDRFAASLGLGPQQFTNIVKAWSMTRDASALAPGTRRLNQPSRSKRGGVEPSAREATRAVVAELGPQASLGALLQAVRERCSALGVEPPSRGTIWLLSVEARGGGAESKPLASAILVARAFLRLPVDMGSDIVIPEVVIAAETPTGRILSAVLPDAGSPHDLLLIRRAIASHRGGSPLPVAADERDADGLSASLPPSTQLSRLAPSLATLELSKTLGRRLGRLELTYRVPTMRPTTLMQSGRDRAPGIGDARLALDIACRRHNADLDSMGTTSAFRGDLPNGLRRAAS